MLRTAVLSKTIDLFLHTGNLLANKIFRQFKIETLKILDNFIF